MDNMDYNFWFRFIRAAFSGLVYIGIGLGLRFLWRSATKRNRKKDNKTGKERLL